MTPNNRHPSKTALIVEENLGRTVGHYDAWIDGISGAFQREGLAVTVLGAKEARRLPSQQPIEPWFDRIYLDAYFGAQPRFASRLVAALRHNVYLYRRAATWFRAQPRYDLVMATQVNVFHLLGWRLIWMMFGRRKIRRLVLLSTAPMWLHEYDDAGERHHHKGAPLVAALYRLFGGAVRRGDILLAAETEHDARAIEKASGIPVVAVPTPRPDGLIQAARERILERRSGGPRPPVLGWLGRCSEEKGFASFFEATRRFLAAHPAMPCTVLIQYLSGPEECRVPAEEVERLAASDTRLRLVRQPAAGDNFGRLLGELDCLVVPYRRRNYVGRNSSAALDAVLAGIPMITTEGTWMAEFMARHGAGFTCQDQDPTELSLRMEQFVAAADELERTAWERSEEARSAISWSKFTQLVMN
jgi:glycosyltransferase involved in cell wall biosynthesis